MTVQKSGTISNTDNDPNILVTGIIHTHSYLINRNGEVSYMKQTKKISHTKPKKLFTIK